MRRKGFTLIELLVVIAIIAILAAILFPVFSRARKSALQNACLSNEKQLDLAMQQYVIDYDHCLPIARNDNYNGTQRPGDPSTVYAQLYPYVKNADIYHCPLSADNSAPATYTAAELAAGFVNIPFSGYLTNGNLVDRQFIANTPRVLSLENVPDPSTVAFLAESPWRDPSAGYGCPGNTKQSIGNPPMMVVTAGLTNLGCYYGQIPAVYAIDPYYQPTATWPHNNGINMAFGDGHVEFRARGEVTGFDYGMKQATSATNFESAF